MVDWKQKRQNVIIKIDIKRLFFFIKNIRYFAYSYSFSASAQFVNVVADSTVIFTRQSQVYYLHLCPYFSNDNGMLFIFFYQCPKTINVCGSLLNIQHFAIFPKYEGRHTIDPKFVIQLVLVNIHLKKF